MNGIQGTANELLPDSQVKLPCNELPSLASFPPSFLPAYFPLPPSHLQRILARSARRRPLCVIFLVLRAEQFSASYGHPRPRTTATQPTL